MLILLLPVIGLFGLEATVLNEGHRDCPALGPVSVDYQSRGDACVTPSDPLGVTTIEPTLGPASGGDVMVVFGNGRVFTLEQAYTYKP